VAGTGPGGDGEWRFVVPPQGEGHVDQTLRFYITAQDGNATPQHRLFAAVRPPATPAPQN